MVATLHTLLLCVTQKRSIEDQEEIVEPALRWLRRSGSCACIDDVLAKAWLEHPMHAYHVGLVHH